jgi:hypothetical protein
MEVTSKQTHSFYDPWFGTPEQEQLNKLFETTIRPMRCKAHDITKCQCCTDIALPTVVTIISKGE